jgi:hypothetical protein
LIFSEDQYILLQSSNRESPCEGRHLLPELVEMFQELEVGLKPVTTYEVEERFFEEFRPSKA